MSPASKPSAALPIRLALVDDSELVRLGLRTLLEDAPGLCLVGEAGTAAAALELCARERPDVVLLDIRLPDGTGLDVCRQLRKRLPDTRVIFLTSAGDGQTVDTAIRAGAHGYLLKEVNGSGLVEAVRAVAVGRSVLDPAITARVLQRARGGESIALGRPALDTLSAQEGRVLALVSQGRTNKEAAVELGLSEKTVKNYLSAAFSKLHVTRRAEAAAIFARGRPAAAGEDHRVGQ
jgi:two-component system response regulator DevR